MAKFKILSEYRINKKGAECFRTGIYEEARQKLEELNAKRNVYTLQTRTVNVDRFGDPDLNWKGQLNWSIWREVRV